jgi:hypothetical protein
LSGRGLLGVLSEVVFGEAAASDLVAARAGAYLCPMNLVGIFLAPRMRRQKSDWLSSIC